LCFLEIFPKINLFVTNKNELMPNIDNISVWTKYFNDAVNMGGVGEWKYVLLSDNIRV
jgi:hypothetical protein